MATFTVPATIEGTKALAEDRQSKDWMLAASVYAQTYVKRGGDKAKPTIEGLLNLTEFAAQGIKGLSTPLHVSRWRKTWEAAIADGIAQPVKPGQKTSLPEADFDTYFQRDDVRGSVESTDEMQARVARTYITKNPQVVAEAVKSVPAVAAAIVDDEDASAEISARSMTKRLTGTQVGRVAPAMVPHIDPLKAINDAIGIVHTFVVTEKDGKGPAVDGMTETRLRLLTITLNERVARMDGDKAPDTIASIAAYLKETSA